MHSARSSTPVSLRAVNRVPQRLVRSRRKGKQTLDTLISRGCDRLEELSDGWQPEQHPELRELIQGLARQFIDTTPVASGAPQAS